MKAVKYVLLLPLIYIVSVKLLGFIDNNITEFTTITPATSPATSPKIIKEKKVAPLFTGRLTASGSKENKLTQNQAEDVFYRHVSVNKFERKEEISTPRESTRQPQNFSPILLISDGFSSLINGKMPADKNSIIALLVLFFMLYKTQVMLFHRK